MIAGLPPFESENQHGFIFKRLSEDPLPLRGRNPQVDVPAELDRVVRRALERDREQRFPDAGAFIAALERVEQSLTAVETREIPMSSLDLAMPPLRRRASRPPAPAQLPRRASAAPASSPGPSAIDLLAQIERASKRVQESSGGARPRRGRPRRAGRLDEAERADRADRGREPPDPGARAS